MSNEDSPAFPIAHPDVVGVQYYGITARDYFAAKALSALINHPNKEGVNCGRDAVPILAKFAYEYADAMLIARSA